MQAASLPLQSMAKPTVGVSAGPTTTKTTTTTTTTTKTRAPYCKTYKDAFRLNLDKYHLRFYIVLYSFSLFFAALFQLSFNYHTFINVFSWRTVFFSLLLFTCGSVISILRHMTFTVWKSAYPSYLAETLAVWTSLDNLLLLVVYALSSLFIIHIYMSRIMGEKSATQFLLPAEIYTGARQLNQQNLFIWLYAIMLGVNYTYQYLSKRKFVVKINHIQQPYFFEVKTSLATLLCHAAKRSLWTFLWTYIIFILQKRTFYLYMARIFGLYSRVLDSPIIGFGFADVHLFLRVIIGGILASSIFFFTNRLYEITYSYTLPNTDHHTNQFELLVDGLSNKEKDYIQIAAFSELAVIATKRPEERKQLFETIGLDFSDNAWHKIMTQCCRVIQDFRTLIDIEYNGPQPATKPVPVVKPVQTEEKIQNRLQFSSNGNIYSTTKKNRIYHDDRTAAFFYTESLGELATDDTLPDDITTKVQAFTIKKFKQLTSHQMIKMLKHLELKFGYDGLLKHYYAETLERRIQMVMNRYQLLIWAVESLASLTAASLYQDPYGYVQNDMSQVLNTLLGCLVDIEKYEKQLPASYSKLLKEYDGGVGEVRSVILALKEAIYQIRDTFADYAQGFPINEPYKPKWSRFLEYKE